MSRPDDHALPRDAAELDADHARTEPAEDAPAQDAPAPLADAEQPSSDAGHPADAERSIPARARRFAPLVLLAGAAAAAATLLPHMPHERTIELRLPSAATVVGVEVTWTSTENGEAVQGSSWRFAL